MTALIGVSAPNTERTREIIRTLRTQLQLMRICMRQPLFDALGALLKETTHELERHTPPHEHYKKWGMNQRELEEKFSSLLLSCNSLAFAEHTEQRLQELQQPVTETLFSGYLITGITTTEEAAWLRERGGTMLHIYDYNPLVQYNYTDEHDNDYSITCGELEEAQLANFIATIEDTRQAA